MVASTGGEKGDTDLKVFINILGQVLLRRRFGPLSVIAGLVLAPLWQLYKRLIGRPVVITTYKGTKFRLDCNSITSSRFVYERKPDFEFVSVLASFADEKTAFVDVGGNVGLFTVLLCRDFQKGWLFEPNPVAAAAARRNLDLNDMAGTFEVVEAAVGKEDGAVQFPVLDTPDPVARIGTPGSTGKMMEVRMLHLDGFLPSDGSYVVKIDAEGHDAEVIAGFKGAFSEKRVKIALFECKTDDILAEILGIVCPLGYEVRDGERPLTSPVVDRNRDLFIIRADLAERYDQVFRSARAAA